MIKFDTSGTVILVSISCLTYNHAKYIRQCLDGLLMQKTNFAFEVLIHDDASNDGTEEIIRGYASMYPEIIKPLYEKENQWVRGRKGSAIFNFPRARGKYIALCEGDDYWTDAYKLQKQVDLMEQNPECSMCVAQTEWVKNNKIINITGEGDKLKYDFYDIINGKYFHTSTYLIRKEMLDIYTSANPKLMDGDTSLRYFLSDLGPFVLLNEKVSVYRITESGIWTGMSPKNKTLWHIRVYRSFYYHFKPKYRKHFLKKLIDIYLYQLIINVKQLDIKNFVLDFNQLMFWSLKSPQYFIKSACNIIKSFLFKMVYNFRNKNTYSYSKTH